MLFLELAFGYDTSTKVMLRPNLGNQLTVVGMKSTNGKMIDEFFTHLKREALPYSRSLEEFRSYLTESYGSLPKRLSQYTRLSSWFEQITVSLGPAHNTSGSLLNREIRFYRDDVLSAQTWVWKDDIRKVDVLLP